MSAWWESINREEVATLTRDLLPSGGVLVLAGGEGSGRLQALNISGRMLVGLGFDTISVPATSHISSLRSVLVGLWQAMTPALPTGTMPPWVSGANLPIGTLAERVVSAAVDREPVALMVEDVDRHSNLDRFAVEQLSLLATQASRPLVMTSNVEMGWAVENVRTLSLREFTTEDILRCLQQRPEFVAHYSTSGLEELIDLLRDDDGRLMQPSQVYSVLAAWSNQS